MSFPPLPADIAARTVPELLDAAVAAAPRRAALIAPSALARTDAERVSWTDLAERARRLAAALQDRGVGAGDRVAIMFANDGATEAHVAYHAAHHLAAIAVPVNTRYVARELRYVLAFTQPRAVVFDSAFSAVVDAALSSGERPLLFETAARPALGEALLRALEKAESGRPRARLAEEDEADWIFTSGTTGEPKAVALTHANSVACGHQAMNLWGLGADSTYQSSAPFFTSTGCHTNLLSCLAAACTYVVEPDFDVELTMRRAVQHGTTSIFIVSSLLALMFHRLDDTELRALETGALRRLCYGGQSMGKPFYERMREVFGPPGHDLELVHLYGLTEGGTCGLSLEPELHEEAVDRRCGSFGLTVGRSGFNAWVEHRVTAEDGADVAPGGVGEIRLRAPSVMARYVGHEAATADALDDGWLRTGDMATIDDEGFVFFVDRSKQMIRRGGLNISSAEVEGVVCEHPAVAEAAAVPRPNDVLGQDVHVVAVLKPGTEATQHELIRHCRELLADYKVPTSVAFAAALPRNAMGRVLKSTLADTAHQETR